MSQVWCSRHCNPSTYKHWQDDHPKFKRSLGWMLSSRLTWATQTLSQNTSHAGCAYTCLQSQHWGERGRWICEFQVMLIYRVSWRPPKAIQWDSSLKNIYNFLRIYKPWKKNKSIFNFKKEGREGGRTHKPHQLYNTCSFPQLLEKPTNKT